MLGMQGLGGPGVHHHQLTYFGMPRGKGLGRHLLLEPGDRRALSIPVMSSVTAWQQQVIPKTLITKPSSPTSRSPFHGTGAIRGPGKGPVQRIPTPFPKKRAAVRST
jgi:hypothetical protein